MASSVPVRRTVACAPSKELKGRSRGNARARLPLRLHWRPGRYNGHACNCLSGWTIVMAM